jgi:N-acetyl-anhydromuramyl-L-alanine amidase AmpD
MTWVASGVNCGRGTMKGNRALFAAVAASCLASCTAEVEIIDELDTAVDLDQQFDAAARKYGVPADLLKAISYVETRWNEVDGHDELGREPAVGVFGLWGDNLQRGAAAANVDEQDVRHDTTANVRAAAARLAELAHVHGVAGDDLVSWRGVIAEFAQNPDDEARGAYVDDVLRVLTAGVKEYAEDGRVIASIEPRTEIGMQPLEPIYATNTDYAKAVWRASPNYNSRGGSKVSLVVIHSCEGGYAGCWGWLRNSKAGASAHYVVNEAGSEVTQLVREASRAWHVSASYDCKRAGNAQCTKNGVSTNTFSVGIEHAGYASQKSWASGLIETSARLTCDITKRHGVPRDRNHIVSHGQLQPYNRTDPGAAWPWTHYIDRVRAICNGTSGGGSSTTPTSSGPTIIVDSNNANNNQAVARIELKGTWTSASSVAGYYGTGYWWASTAATSAPATFWFYLPAAGTRTIDAWWTAASNRATAAPFIAFNASGTEVGRKAVNQRQNGSKWVTLGTWNFQKGWNKVVLSRWTDSGSVVIADAIRVR